MRLALLLAACFCAAPLFAQGPVPPKDEVFSENKKFSAEVSTEQIDRPLLSVFSRTGDVPVHLWSRPLVAESDDGPVTGLQWDSNGYERSVSNDGSFVILRARYFRPDGPALRVLTQKGGDKAFEGDDFLEFLTDIDNEYAALQPSLLEVMLENENPKLYAFWHPLSHDWVVLNLETLQLQRPTPAQIPRLNELALAQSRAVARDHRPSVVRRALSNLAQRAGALFPAMAPQPRNPGGGADGKTQAAYHYLAYAKKPEDRLLIEALLESELQTFTWFNGYDPNGRPNSAPFLALRSDERLLASQLLDDWDGKRDADEPVEVGYFQPGRSTRFGSLSGVLRLPFGMPPGAGSTYICLVPAKVSASDWGTDERVLRLLYSGQNMRPFPGQPPAPAPAALNFSFDTIEPGEYRVKAFWDRRPPNVLGAPQTPLTPSPGDYESAESPVLKLAAGQRLKNIDLFCTNRVGKAESFFAEDEKWAKDNPSEEPDPTMTPAGTYGYTPKVLVHAPVNAWVLKTNENSANVSIKQIQLTSLRSEIGEEMKRLAVRLSIPRSGSGAQANNIKAELLDDHGCRFETHGYNNSGHLYNLDFTTVPLGSRKWIVQLMREDYQDENGRPFRNGARTTRLAGFTLTNLFQGKPADWKPDSFPARRDLSPVTVELASFNPTANEFVPRPMPGREQVYMGGMPGMPGRAAKNTFSFSQNGKPARGWAKYSGRFIDRWGNEAFNLNQMCQEEEVFKYVVEFVRDPEVAAFADDEKFELSVPKLPGSGESTELNVQQKLQGLPFRIFALSGTGEFTYNEGKLVSAKQEIEDEDASAFFTAQGRPVRPKLMVQPTADANAMRMRMMMQGGNRGPLTIAARVPHIVLRVANGSRDTLFALVQQDTSVPDPIATLSRGPGMPYFPNQPSAIQVLALEPRAAEQDKKLTFTVQKLRKAEFFVRVAPGERSRAPGF